MGDAEIGRLSARAVAALDEWVGRLLAEPGEGCPERVTARRPGMAVRGRYRRTCPVCGSPVQRIVDAENECNGCARSQTGGRLPADRALPRLLRDDQSRTLEAWEGLGGR